VHTIFLNFYHSALFFPKSLTALPHQQRDSFLFCFSKKIEEGFCATFESHRKKRASTEALYLFFISHSENLMNPFQYKRNHITHHCT
jgi:hypothetical protein